MPKMTVLLVLLLCGTLTLGKACEDAFSALQRGIATAEKAGLRYAEDFEGEIVRRATGTKKGKKTYSYFQEGKEIRNAEILQRIEELKIPAGYHRVRIAKDPKSHIQAVGLDDSGQRQFRYHQKWIKERAKEKFTRSQEFGAALGGIRKKYQKALRESDTLDKNRVLAAIVKMIDSSHMRVGSEKYAVENGTYGISSLRKSHIKMTGEQIEIAFKGKAAVKQNIKIEDPEVARVIRQLMKLPGKRLFQYSEDGAHVPADEAAVNEWLKEVAGPDFSIKDFRTWEGSVLAFTLLRGREVPQDENEQKVLLRSVFETVAEKLGNTWSVARESYVHPKITEAFLDGTLGELPKSRSKDEPTENDEKHYLEFLGR